MVSAAFREHTGILQPTIRKILPTFTLRMKHTKRILTYLFGLFMILGGIIHFVNPEMYFAFIPDALPQALINYIGGAVELVMGIGVFIPRYRHVATRGILILMLAFLPLHIWDVFRQIPAIGSHTAALVRLPFQFVLIAWAWYIQRIDQP